MCYVAFGPGDHLARADVELRAAQHDASHGHVPVDETPFIETLFPFVAEKGKNSKFKDHR